MISKIVFSLNNKLLMLVCLCLFFNSCSLLNNQEEYITETQGFEPTASDVTCNTDANLFDCFNISQTVMDDVDSLLALKGYNKADTIIKQWSIHSLNLYGFLMQHSFEDIAYNNLASVGKSYIVKSQDTSENNNYLMCGYDHYADGVGDMYPIAHRKIDYAKDNDVNWELVIDFISDPSRIFGEDIYVKNAFCITAYTPYRNSQEDVDISDRDIFVYYVTNRGDYLLYRPYLTEASKYSEDMFLIPRDCMSTVFSSVKDKYDENGNYKGETQLRKLVDISQYRFEHSGSLKIDDTHKTNDSNDFDCLSFPKSVIEEVTNYNSNNYGTVDVRLKIRTFYAYEAYVAMSENLFDFFNSYADNLIVGHTSFYSNIPYHTTSDIGFEAFFDYDSSYCTSPITLYKNEDGKHANWGLMYDYITNPEKVFGNAAIVKDVFCIESNSNEYFFAGKDLFVYYITDQGDYILYKPYYRNDCEEVFGYTDDIYLIPPYVIGATFEYIRNNCKNDLSAVGLRGYEGKSQICEIIDLEPYKLVPGQLPK